MTVATRLSASRLNEYLGCAHRSALWLAGVSPSELPDPSEALLQSKGFEHEARVLARLENEHGSRAVKIGAGDVETRIAETALAIKSGAPLIYQAALFDQGWIGFPDFLVRSPEKKNGAWVYKPEDAKLAKRAKPDHVLQLGVYARLLSKSFGTSAPDGVIHVADNPPETFDLRETEFITQRLMDQFSAFAQLPHRETRSLKCAACSNCGYQSRCEEEWRRADSPIFVAGLRTDQLLKLEATGTGTLSALASLPHGTSVPGIGVETLTKLIAQAALQKTGAVTGKYQVEVLPAEPGRGFSLLPKPQLGDLYFDMEGDPLHPEGLEYLFGIYGPLSDQSQLEYRSFWAHNHSEEKTAFEELIGFFRAHLRRFPLARIFHYAQYEEVALKRLAMRYATMEIELDQLLYEQRFVDLYRVVKQSIRASTESYSLKDLEKIYWGGRSGAVTNAGDSIVEYERWLTTRDPAIIDSIALYNKDDCISTLKLRFWLEGLRPADADYGASREPEGGLVTRSPERIAFERRREQLASRVRCCDTADDRVRDLVAELLWFHQRSQKPQWWAVFDRQTWSDDELVEDAESLGTLSLDLSQPIEQIKKSYRATYRFPPQETKLKVGSRPKVSLTLAPAGLIEDLDPDEGRIVLKRETKAGPFPQNCSLSPAGPLDQSVLVDGVMAFAERFANGETAGDAALLNYLERRAPRVHGIQPGAPLLAADSDLVCSTVELLRKLEESALFIQGPPGTGKTYTSSHGILALLKDGKRIAVSSNSHKAINNLLKEVEKRALEAGFDFSGVKKGSREDSETAYDGRLIETVTDSAAVQSSHMLVGATAFHFAQEAANSYDYLFVDEAGQVALGNLVAMAACARNLVLIGDQMQLPQPVQGVHPGESGLSCLEYLLQHRATVPADRGVLLDISYRMHPAICQLVSDAIYDGRLKADARNAERRLVLSADAHPALQPAGITFLNVEHQGCTQSSPEEVLAIAALLKEILRQQLQDVDKPIRQLSLDDVLIVAPFNMQVNRLKRALPSGARVGTVDKFQGQQAPVVIVSMTTSRGDDAPRGTAFLFNRNRFNVAVSRAQCLAVVVQSPELQNISIGSIDDLVRLNLFARAEMGAKLLSYEHETSASTQECAEATALREFRRTACHYQST